MTADRRGFLASLLALPVVARLIGYGPTFDGKTMRLRLGQSMAHPSGLRVAYVDSASSWPPPDGIAWNFPTPDKEAVRLQWPDGPDDRVVYLQRIEVCPGKWAEVTFS